MLSEVHLNTRSSVTASWALLISLAAWVFFLLGAFFWTGDPRPGPEMEAIREANGRIGGRFMLLSLSASVLAVFLGWRSRSAAPKRAALAMAAAGFIVFLGLLFMAMGLFIVLQTRI